MSLYFNTINPILHDYLLRLMGSNTFKDFYLCGGTALSLQLGHRISVDIDLFTCSPYGTIDLESLKSTLPTLFKRIDNIECLRERQMVYSLYVGDADDTMVKLDLCYDEQPVFPLIETEGLRMVSDKDIAAMKLLSIVTGNRCKDFWDIHKLMKIYSLEEMIEWSLKRNPYTLERDEILLSFDKVWEFSEPGDIITLTNDKWPFIADELYTEAHRLLKI